jgi:hypothetical protein
VIVDSEEKLNEASGGIRRELEGLPEHELLVCCFVRNGFSQFIESRAN